MINDIDCGPTNLNEDCGAEFVHKMKSLPKNFPKTESLGVCIDGDADRLIYFLNDDGKIKLIDGDK